MTNDQNMVATPKQALYQYDPPQRQVEHDIALQYTIAACLPTQLPLFRHIDDLRDTIKEEVLRFEEVYEIAREAIEGKVIPLPLVNHLQCSVPEHD